MMMVMKRMGVMMAKLLIILMTTMKLSLYSHDEEDEVVENPTDGDL